MDSGKSLHVAVRAARRLIHSPVVQDPETQADVDKLIAEHEQDHAGEEETR